MRAHTCRDDVNKMQDAFGAADDNYDGELDADEASAYVLCVFAHRSALCPRSST